VIATPAYPVYWRSALLAGGVPTPLPLEEGDGFLPQLDRLSDEVWQETALLWINTPHNPTGAVASTELLGRVSRLARDHDFVAASDEAYSEIYCGSPPASLLNVGKRNSLVFHSLSKRSAMTGYRSGFVAGDAELINRYRRLRPTLGVATPEFVQCAAISAWQDEEHVDAIRASFGERRRLFLGCLEALGLEHAGGEGTFFLWVRAPHGDDVALAEKWFAEGVLTIPGSWLGAGGRGYLRVALVPTLEKCREAAERITRAQGV
jgi:aspartate/methionine/tyrosine aminotransferase